MVGASRRVGEHSTSSVCHMGDKVSESLKSSVAIAEK